METYNLHGRNFFHPFPESSRTIRPIYFHSNYFNSSLPASQRIVIYFKLSRILFFAALKLNDSHFSLQRRFVGISEKRTDRSSQVTAIGHCRVRVPLLNLSISPLNVNLEAYRNPFAQLKLTTRSAVANLGLRVAHLTGARVVPFKMSQDSSHLRSPPRDRRSGFRLTWPTWAQVNAHRPLEGSRRIEKL